MIKKMEVEFKRDENIMRFLTVSLDKFAVKYAEGCEGLDYLAKKLKKQKHSYGSR